MKSYNFNLNTLREFQNLFDNFSFISVSWFYSFNIRIKNVQRLPNRDDFFNLHLKHLKQCNKYVMKLFFFLVITLCMILLLSVGVEVLWISFFNEYS